ncbi:leucine-rich repeat domain-containing protein [Simkania sp.]|uniref:leucine-rich repeat domain-containing protein n=1 Tax=Simkania sp. TaxID=34094 RepID=UPI003B518247
MGALLQTDSLKHQVLSRYLFDQNFQLQGQEEAAVSDVIAYCLDGICAVVNSTHPEFAEREWNIQPKATLFEKLQAAFHAVTSEKTKPASASQRGDLIAYYQTLRNEQLKESRLFLWAILLGHSGNPHAGRAYLEKNHLIDCTGDQIAEKFQSWLEENPEILLIDRLFLAESKVGLRLTYLPPEIGRFTELRSLTIMKTGLQQIPHQIGKLSKLRKLSLNDNRLTKLPPEIEQCRELKSLILSRNVIEELPLEIGNLTQLTELSLTDNDLKELPLELGDLTNLELLRLGENPLEEVPLYLNRLAKAKSSQLALSAH